MRWVLLLVLVACSSKRAEVPPPPQPRVADAAPIVPIDAAPPPDAEVVFAPPDAAPPNCKIDAAAQQACVAKGAGFAYGPAPVFWCSGVAPPRNWQRDAAAKVKRSPCECTDLAAVQQHRESCASRP
jgi:hypothetical protein